MSRDNLKKTPQMTKEQAEAASKAIDAATKAAVYDILKDVDVVKVARDLKAQKKTIFTILRVFIVTGILIMLGNLLMVFLYYYFFVR